MRSKYSIALVSQLVSLYSFLTPPPLSQFTEPPEAVSCKIYHVIFSKSADGSLSYTEWNPVLTPRPFMVWAPVTFLITSPTALSFAYSPLAMLAPWNTPSMLLLWNLWICYFLSLEYPSPCTHMAWSFTSFSFLLKCHIITESFPDHSF